MEGEGVVGRGYGVGVKGEGAGWKMWRDRAATSWLSSWRSGLRCAATASVVGHSMTTE